MNAAERAVHAKLRTSPLRDLLYAARNLGAEMRTLVRHARGRRQARSLQGPLKLHFGCGDDVRNGWINIDLCPAADIQLDARRALPFSGHSATIIYSEHFVEHLELQDARRFLSECHRVLAEGGRLSISVPDARQPVEEYVAGGGPLLSHAIDAGWHSGVATLLDQINALFRQGDQHRYSWDAETLIHYVAEAGFSEPFRRDFDPDLDSEARRIGSLWIDAVK
jgi:predicted SAM-dependent methyltransferase